MLHTHLWLLLVYFKSTPICAQVRSVLFHDILCIWVARCAQNILKLYTIKPQILYGYTLMQRNCANCIVWAKHILKHIQTKYTYTHINMWIYDVCECCIYICSRLRSLMSFSLDIIWFLFDEIVYHTVHICWNVAYIRWSHIIFVWYLYAVEQV